MVRAWIEAMRLRTLPVSVAGVICGCGCAAYYGSFKILPALICLLFAVMAQIVSNFANEYFDYKKGFDKPGREGFRRGVTEGDISPRAMRNATAILLATTCAVGATLMIWGEWWLIFVGIAIAVFAMAYSTGPWPLSHHGLGEVAVVIFFGLVPVIFTAWVQCNTWSILPVALPLSLAVGLMGANVMIVNNYRDIDDDRAVGKHTLAVIMGRSATATLYLINGFLALLLLEIATALRINPLWQLGPLVYINIHWLLWQYIRRSRGAALNPALGRTAILMLLLSVWEFVALSLSHTAQ